ncbi:Protein CBG01108 [Caenorhabditis briggsae]|uniref:Protein CBG01108 n=1 Tax=Caenorhabditis briggsae TaxID=6238 RepID=A8WPK7_CAEBR|nr:Protein CBG01108 [Caenorhabditis briggsae]CAP22414.2 Protein CBG01108 [Caenorhabditis briggsae]
MPALQKCRICGSAKHIGSRYRADSTCAACASFFRRIVNLKKSENLKCRTLSEKCLEEQFLDPDKNSKKLCKFCRYQKCLKIGMEPEWSEETTMVLVTKNTGPEINTFRKLDDEMSKNLKNLRSAERIITEYTEIFLDSENQKFEKILENVAGQNGHSIVPLE